MVGCCFPYLLWSMLPLDLCGDVLLWLYTFLLHCLALPLACSIGTTLGLQLVFAIYVYTGTSSGRRQLCRTVYSVSIAMLLVLALAPMCLHQLETRMMRRPIVTPATLGQWDLSVVGTGAWNSGVRMWGSGFITWNDALIILYIWRDVCESVVLMVPSRFPVISCILVKLCPNCFHA